MRRTDPVTPIAAGLHSAGKLFPAFSRLGLCGMALIIALSTLGTFHASAQDVADAARQERARKEAQQKKPRHVYTEDDLKRAQILTPEDRAALEAKRNQQLADDPDKTEEALDSLPLLPDANPSSLTPDFFPSALPPDAPLGDVARYYRRWKISQALRRDQQFPLMIPNPPVLASPKGMQPLELAIPAAEPSPPRFDPSRTLVHPSHASHPIIELTPPAPPQFTPFQPPVKRSPFARPKFFTAEPPHVLSSRPTPSSLATQPPAAPAPPSKPRALGNPSNPVAPAQQVKPSTHVNPPALVTPNAPANPPASATPWEQTAPRKAFVPGNPSKPNAPTSTSKPAARANAPSLAAPSSPALPLASAAPSAPVAPKEPAKPFVLGAPSKPAVPAKPSGSLAHVNPPALVAPATPAKPLPSAVPSVLVAPSRPSAPASAASPAPVVARHLAGSAVTVQPGDSLWKLAAQHLGEGRRWQELVAVNPTIRNANHIEPGWQILVPATVPSSRTPGVLTVRQGDTLSGIAKAHLGHASARTCIARANPSIRNPHLIYAGQSLVLPASCKP